MAKNGQQLREIADGIAKGFAKGKFQTEELNKFLERGINLLPELEKVTGKQGEELSKAIQKGLSFETVREALANMSREGGAFFGMLERRSRTTSGLLSTLRSMVELVRRDFATPINDALKPIITRATALLEQFREKAAAVGQKISQLLVGGFAAIEEGQALPLLKAGLRVAFATAGMILMRNLRSAVAFLGGSLGVIFQEAAARLADPNLLKGFKSLFLSLGSIVAAGINDAMGKDEAAALNRDSAASNLAAAGTYLGMAGSGRSADDILAEAVVAGLKKAQKAFQDFEKPAALEEAQAELDEILATVKTG